MSNNDLTFFPNYKQLTWYFYDYMMATDHGRQLEFEINSATVNQESELLARLRPLNRAVIDKKVSSLPYEEIVPLLETAVNNEYEDLPPVHKENLRQMQWAFFLRRYRNETYDNLIEVKTELFNEYAKHKVRETGDFSKIKELFEEKIRLSREYAEDLADGFKLLEIKPGPNFSDAYGAMLRVHEYDADKNSIVEFAKALSNNVKETYFDIVKVQESMKVLPIDHVQVDDAAAVDITRTVLSMIGIDCDNFEIAASNKSSCSGMNGWAKMRLKVNPKSIVRTLISGAHEGGHGGYFQHQPILDDLAPYVRQPVTDKRGLTLSEGSAYFLQQITTFREFWDVVAPVIRKRLNVPESDEAYNSENLFRHAIRLNGSLGGNRLQADRIGMLAHIGLRVEAENALLSGEITVDGLSDYWAQKSEEALGIVPSEPQHMFTQDVHWFKQILFGYFPNYATGFTLAENLIQHGMKTGQFNPEDFVSRGFDDFYNYGRKVLFDNGALYSDTEILKKYTKHQRLDAEAMLEGIHARYTNFSGAKHKDERQLLDNKSMTAKINKATP